MWTLLHMAIAKTSGLLYTHRLEANIRRLRHPITHQREATPLHNKFDVGHFITPALATVDTAAQHKRKLSFMNAVCNPPGLACAVGSKLFVLLMQVVDVGAWEQLQCEHTIIALARLRRLAPRLRHRSQTRPRPPGQELPPGASDTSCNSCSILTTCSKRR